jgi:hypothetical protein
MLDRGKVMRSGSLEGALFDTDEDFAGWARDTARPNEALAIELVINGEAIAVARADRLSSERDRGSQLEDRSFKFRAPTLPSFVFPVEIFVRISGTEVMLGSRRFERPRDAAPFMESFPVGHTDGVRDGSIVGWAVDLAHADRVCCIEVFIDGERVARVPCSGLRADLADAGIPSTTAGFAYALPRSILDGRSHSIAVRFAATGELVPNGAFVFGVSADSALVAQIAELSTRISALEREVGELRAQSFERFDALLALRFQNLANELKASQGLVRGRAVAGR